ncbi:MAG: AzlD domain-containing protein [Anaerolineaceae bacterium]|nr:MAG: AzlD domain-containing protein [Anaerolineaceae bacterium]
MNEWVLISGMAIVTFSVRYPVLAILGRLDLPPALTRALKYVPAVVLTAIIMPEILLHGGTLDVAPTNPRLIGALVAGVIAWRTRDLLWTIGGGMAAFFAWRLLFG